MWAAVIPQETECDKMNEFKTYHPIVNFIYFVLVIGFAMVFMNPICLLISLVGSFLYSVILKGKKAVKSNLLYMLPMVIVMALMNPAFNHEGVTIIEYLPSGNPLTVESVVYGAAAAAMIVGVICWFSCYNEVMTSDKFIYLFGRIIPSLSLILSMTLRFVPKFSAQLKTVRNAQKCVGKDPSCGGVARRVKNGISILSVMATWALESSVETADSMKSRGYGLKGRSAFSVFKFDKRDGITLFSIALLSGYIAAVGVMGKMKFRYFPSLKGAEISLLGISGFAAYFALCLMPTVIEIREVRRWKKLTNCRSAIK